MIGDGIGTDLAAARAVGARCVIMLTGVSTRERGRGPPRRRATDRGRRGRDRAGRRPGGARRGSERRLAPPVPPSSGMPAAQSSKDARNGASVASSAKATSSARRSMAHSSGRVSPICSTALTYSSDSLMSDTVVSSVLRVTGTPRRWSRASGCAATDGTMPACQFEVGQRSREIPRARSSSHKRGVVDGARAVGDALAAPRRARGGPGPRRPIRRRGSSCAGRWPVRPRRPARGRAGRDRRPRARRGPSRSGPRRGTVAAVSASSTFPSASWERSAVQMRRTTVPVREAPSRAPAHTAAIPSARERPRATWRRGPQRIST